MRIEIERLAYGGDGIAHLPDGRTAFVTGSCPGDVVEAELLAEHPRYVNLIVTEVLTPSEQRVKPPCPYFGVCGGCQWQHVSYQAQLTAKTASVADALARIGGQSVPVAPCVPSSTPYHYRNKVELIAEETDRGLQLGFLKAHSTELVPIESCLLLPKQLAKAPHALSGALRYIAGRDRLALSRVAIRSAVRTRDTEVALWTNPGPFPRQLAARTLSDALPTTSVVRVLFKGEIKERATSGVEVLKGKGFWKERMSGFGMAVSAPSFFQVNTVAAERLVHLVMDGLAPTPRDRVLDLYAGVGTFTMPLADTGADVVAVEQSSSAIGDLRRNLENAELFADIAPGDAGRALADLGGFDLAVVDPPRSGMTPEALAGVIHARPRRIAYVSCDPATLARDSKTLAESGYALVRATPVDLFPQTYHVETVAFFEAQA